MPTTAGAGLSLRWPPRAHHGCATGLGYRAGASASPRWQKPDLHDLPRSIGHQARHELAGIRYLVLHDDPGQELVRTPPIRRDGASHYRVEDLVLVRNARSRSMDAYHRLFRFGGAAKDRARCWKSAVKEPFLSARKLIERGLQSVRLRPEVTLFSAGMGVVTLSLLIFSSVTTAPTALGAWFVLMRHFEQTHADRQRRITEGSPRPLSSSAAISSRCAWGASIPWSGFRRKARMTTGR